MTRLLFIISGFFFTSYTFALSPGKALKEFSLKDQHNVESKVDASIKYLLFAKDKKAIKIIEEAFKDTHKEYFPNKKLIYIVDLSRIPGFVLSWFVLPKMKGYPYKVLIDDKPEVTNSLPTKKDQVTLIYLNNLKIIKVEYFNYSLKLLNKVNELN